MATLKDIAAALKRGASPIAQAGRSANAATQAPVQIPTGAIGRAGAAAANQGNVLRNQLSQLNNVEAARRAPATSGLRAVATPLPNIDASRLSASRLSAPSLQNPIPGAAGARQQYMTPLGMATSRPNAAAPSGPQGPFYGGTAVPGIKVGTALNPGVGDYRVASNRGLTPISPDRF